MTNITPVTVNAGTISLTGFSSQGQTALATITGSFSSNGITVSGTVNSISIQLDGTTAISATGLDVPVSSYEAIGTSAFTTDATKGHDLVTVNSTRSGTWNTGAGNDTINPGSGDDKIDGGSGLDTLVVNATVANASFATGNSGSTVSSADGRDTFSTIEFIQFLDQTISVIAASRSDETVFGNAYSGVLRDLMTGTSGADHMNGLTGNDTLLGGSGNDTLKGGSGDDRLLGGLSNDTLLGQDGKDILLGEDGNDLLNGGAGNDRVNGGKDDDRLTGGNGHDTLAGSQGDDSLVGGAGNDTLLGGNGRDSLIGHKGNDLLVGGGGKDIFVFHKNHGDDTIRDFASGQDLIEIGRGASRFGQLDITQQQDDVLISFANVTILVEDASWSDIAQADNFLF
ncbi:calcium-binding protein [Pseudophaeobacter leonis]|uniref:calcium-binding protein n=1 Tax=Pseudophaeobacter leonis TaxID=1144477 RepID=UPI0009F6DD24|nr:calcium-binding protein [Pseudophaeobacter leonis]